MTDHIHSRKNATSSADFYDELEPPDPPARSELSEALAAVLERVMTSRRECVTDEALEQRLLESWRNFVALVFVLRPELLPSAPAWRIAQALGVTKQCFSRLAVRWSDTLGGLRSGSMRSKVAREKYRTSNVSRGAGIPKRQADPIGGRVDRDAAQRTARIIKEAVERFRSGKPWNQSERHVLRNQGFLTDGDELTDAGLELIKTTV